VSPIRRRAWPPSCQERARQQTPPEIQLRFEEDREFQDEPQRDMFQEVRTCLSACCSAVM
jgi:hypothetical protein